jgi:hypothetical protein
MVPAASKPVDPDKLPKVECSSLHYSKAFLNKHPKAPAACLEARVYEGRTYLKVMGKVYLKSKGSVTMAFQNAAGDALGTVTVKPTKSNHVLFDGEEVPLSQVRKGEVLTFWIPESVFGASTPTS